MKFDLSQYKELDRNELIVQSGGYYGTGNVYVSDAYVYANASQYYRNSVNRGTQSRGSTNGYVSTGGGVASSVPVTPVGYLVQTSTGHIYVNADGQQITVSGYVISSAGPNNGAEAPGTGPNPMELPSTENGNLASEGDDPLSNEKRWTQKALGGSDGQFREACFFFSLLYAVEEEKTKRTGKNFYFSLNEIKEMQKSLIEARALGGDLGTDIRYTGQKQILTTALQTAGLTNVSATWIDSTDIPLSADYTILGRIQDPGQGPHFQLGSNGGQYLEDPWAGTDRIENQFIKGSIIFE